MSSKEIKSLIERMNSIQASAKGDIVSDPKASYELLLASRELNTALEDPSQIATFEVFSGMFLTWVRLAIELRIFEKVAESKKPLTVRDLAADGSAEEVLILSIARVLVSKSYLGEETTKDGVVAYVPTKMTKHMLKPSVRAGFMFHYDAGLPILVRALSYFQSNGFRLQQGHGFGLFQYAHNTIDLDYVYCSKQPGIMETFSTYMQGYCGSGAQPTPVEWFPFDRVCFEHFDPSRSEYAYVDVGGGRGQHSKAILEKYRESIPKGKFIVQDLEPVIDDIEKSDMILDDRIEIMAYDYHTPQPTRGAGTYMFENVLHHHNDAVAKEVLEVVKSAMQPGFSKLLISTIILPEQSVPFYLAIMDVAVICVNGGKERTEAEWKVLLESTGFLILKFWYPPGAGNGVIEAEIA